MLRFAQDDRAAPVLSRLRAAKGLARREGSPDGQPSSPNPGSFAAEVDAYYRRCIGPRQTHHIPQVKPHYRPLRHPCFRSFAYTFFIDPRLRITLTFDRERALFYLSMLYHLLDFGAAVLAILLHRHGLLLCQIAQITSGIPYLLHRLLCCVFHITG